MTILLGKRPALAPSRAFRSACVHGKSHEAGHQDGYWVAEVPSLPGCVSQGRTKEEAIANVKEAIQG